MVGAADGVARTVGSSDKGGLEVGLDVVGTKLGATDGFCELGTTVRLLDGWVGDIEAT